MSMAQHVVTGLAIVACSLILTPSPTFSQSGSALAQAPGKSTADAQSPEWFLYRPDPGAAGRGGANAAGRGGGATDGASAGRTGADGYAVPGCARSPICAPRPPVGAERPFRQQVQWKTTMGWTLSNPFADLPEGGGGVAAVAVDSKDNVWAFQRNAVGKPQLFKFDANHKLVLTIPEDAIGHQYKPHGMKVDAGDNVWI